MPCRSESQKSAESIACSAPELIALSCLFCVSRLQTSSYRLPHHNTTTISEQLPFESRLTISISIAPTNLCTGFFSVQLKSERLTTSCFVAHKELVSLVFNSQGGPHEDKQKNLEKISSFTHSRNKKNVEQQSFGFVGAGHGGGRQSDPWFVGLHC
jgi:hypothetical protein